MALDLARVAIELGGAGVFLLYVLWHLENDPAAPRSTPHPTRQGQPLMTTRTQDELAAEMISRFGTNQKNWAFICPNCGDIATVQDFIDAAGLEEGPVRFGQECIGRSLGTLDYKPAEAYPGRGCDWAAYGLFRGPDFIKIPKADGTTHSVPCFRIAPAPQSETSAA